jgi:hypothetical protein
LQIIQSKIKFYNKFWCKLDCINTLAHTFREKQFNYTRQVLEAIQHDYDKGNELYLKRKYIEQPVDRIDFLDAKILLRLFEAYEGEYRIRVENPTISVYSNDEDWLRLLDSRINRNCTLSIPNHAVKDMLHKGNVVFLKKPTKYKFRVTLKGDVNPEFGKWVLNNKDKIKIGRTALNEILNGGYCTGFYFYCTTEKVLHLAQIMIGSNIRKVEEVILDPTIDK